MKILSFKRIAIVLAFLGVVLLPEILRVIGIEDREIRSHISFLTSLMIWGIFVLSYDLLFGYTGLLSLGHSVFLGLGAYGAALTAVHWGVGFWSALLFGILAAVLFSTTLGYLLVRIRGYGFSVATAVLAVIASLLLTHFSQWTGGTQGLRLPQEALEFGFFDLSFLNSNVKYFFSIAVLAFVLCGLYWLVKTPLGRAFTLVRENEERAKLLGYATTRIKWVAFSISGSIAGLAGSLLTLSQRSIDVGPIQWTTSIETLAWTIIGGAGSLIGPLLGMGLLKEIQEISSGLWPQGYLLLSGVLLILFARFLPRGLVGLIGDLRSRSAK
jgi:branched-chain amino acid transport system permease protein